MPRTFKLKTIYEASITPVKNKPYATISYVWRGTPSPSRPRSTQNGVNEVKRRFKACSVFAWISIWYLTYNQLNNNLVSQAATTVTNGVPNDVVSNLDPIAFIILILICDVLIHPALRRAGIHFTPIKRITLGFYTSAASMVWSAVVQHYIYKNNPCGYHVATCKDALTSTLNGRIQTPSYVLIDFSEIFASITGLEYAFTKAPNRKSMRSLVMSVFLFTSAISAAIGQAFVALSEDPRLLWNYATMAVLTFVAGTIFWFQYRHVDAVEDELNEIAEGQYEEKKH